MRRQLSAAGHGAAPIAAPRRFPLVGSAWVVVAAITWLAFLAAGSERALVGGLATIVVTIPLLALGRRRVRWFHPLILVTIPAAIGVGMRSWYLLFAGEREGAQELLRGEDAARTVAIGATVIGVGLLALVGGFMASRRQPSQSPADHPGGDWVAPWGWTNVILVGAIAIGLIGTLLYFRAIGGVSLDALSAKRYVQLDGGGLSSGAFYSRAAAVPALVALALVAKTARGVPIPRPTLLLMIGCVLIGMIAPFVASSRAELIAILMMVAIVWTSRSATISLGLVAIGAVFLAIFVTMGSLRCEHQTGSGEGCSGFAQVEDALLANESWMSVTKTAHIYHGVPGSVEFQNGRTLTTALLAPIPRVLWADKPAVRADGLVAFEILGLPEERRTGAPPGIVGELYLNWGWAAVILGMVALGWFLRRLWDWHLSNQSDFAVAAFAIVVTHMALRLPAGDFAGSFWPAAQGIVVLVAVMAVGAFVSKRGQRQRRRAPTRLGNRL